MQSILRLALVAVLPLGLVAAGAGESFARQSQLGVTAWSRFDAPPFGIGEKAEYQVKLGGITVGSGAMEITGVQQVNGHDTFHAVMRLSGGLPLARVDDRFESWIDVDGLFSRRFKQDQKEITFKRKRTYEFYPERKMFRRLDNGELGTIPTDRPLDDVAFLYFVRTLPLKPGDVYTIPRYFKEDGNPVVIKVLRRETIEVPAGKFNTVVVQPIIKTDGLFGEGGEAEVYFTDDSRRMLVQLRSKVPVVGSLSLHLKEYRAGQPFASR
jgi:hypothetical protein